MPVVLYAYNRLKGKQVRCLCDPVTVGEEYMIIAMATAGRGH